MYNLRSIAMENLPDIIAQSGQQIYLHSNRIERVVLLAMREILGYGGELAVFNFVKHPEFGTYYQSSDQTLKFSSSHINHLQATLESVYGIQAGRGLAVRIGRACLKYILREFGTEPGLADPAFRLLPLQAKLLAGAQIFASLFNKYTDQSIRLERDDKFIYWYFDRCPLCWQRHAEVPCCHLAVGLLQEVMHWLSGGKNFDVEEKQCIACGDNMCTIQINRFPIN